MEVSFWGEDEVGIGELGYIRLGLGLEFKSNQNNGMIAKITVQIMWIIQLFRLDFSRRIGFELGFTIGLKLRVRVRVSTRFIKTRKRLSRIRRFKISYHQIMHLTVRIRICGSIKTCKVVCDISFIGDFQEPALESTLSELVRSPMISKW